MQSVFDNPVDVPVLSIQSETFHWPKNLEAMLRQYEPGHNGSKFILVKGTAHQDFSDFPFLFPWSMRMMKLSGSNSAIDSWKNGWGPACIDFIRERLALSLQSENTLQTQTASQSVVILDGDEAFHFLKENPGKALT